METTNTIKLLKFGDFFLNQEKDNIFLSKNVSNATLDLDNNLFDNFKILELSLAPSSSLNNNKEEFIHNTIYSIFYFKKNGVNKESKNYVFNHIFNNTKAQHIFDYIKNITYDFKKNKIYFDFQLNNQSNFEIFKEEILTIKDIKLLTPILLIEKNNNNRHKSKTNCKFFLVIENNNYCIYNTWYLFKNNSKRKLLFETNNMKTLYWYLINFHY